MEIEENLAAIEKLLSSLIKFADTYLFQITGALVFLQIGLKVTDVRYFQADLQEDERACNLK